MYKTYLLNSNKNESISDLLKRSDIPFSMPCGGNHKCGKCLIYIKGDISPISKSEEELLLNYDDDWRQVSFAPNGVKNEPVSNCIEETETSDGFDKRLACFTSVSGEVEIKIPYQSGEKILLDSDLKHNDTIFLDDIGASFDIGTTVVAGFLYLKGSKEPVVSLGKTNSQQKFGADVISRISYSNEASPYKLRDAICNQISEMMFEMFESAGIKYSRDTKGEGIELCITGNTTMLYLLYGYSPKELGIAPYHAEHLFGEYASLEIPGFEKAEIYIPPCISAFIGADITCGILASELVARPNNTLLIDVGTNGEMALWHDGEIVCASTAAGPAFEGADISMGSRARNGAIDKVKSNFNNMDYSTIGNENPTSICGSGLVDAIRTFLEMGYIDKTGAITNRATDPIEIGDSGISISQNDIRQFQMAKAAIRAGIKLLCKECNITEDDISEILLCGGFGNYINVESAEKIGLLPKGAASKTKVLGNASGAGASILLKDKNAIVEVEKIAKKSRVYELIKSPDFTNVYVENMNF